MNENINLTNNSLPNYVYIVPPNTTFKLGNRNNYVINSALKKPMGVNYALTATLVSPYGNIPCFTEAYFYYNNIWRKGVSEGLTSNASNNVYGILTSCPGNGNVYISIGGGGCCGNRNTSCVPATGTIVASAEVVILLVPIELP